MREEKTRSLPIELPFAKAREADRPCLRLRPYKELVVPLEELSQDVEAAEEENLPAEQLVHALVPSE